MLDLDDLAPVFAPPLPPFIHSALASAREDPTPHALETSTSMIGGAAAGLSGPSVFVGGVVAAGLVVWCLASVARLFAHHRQEQQGWSQPPAQDDDDYEDDEGTDVPDVRPRRSRQSKEERTLRASVESL